jgi:phage terminase small subunit
MPNPLVPIEDDSQLGPAMQACTLQQRKFVLALFEQKPGYGALAAAARAAEYGNRDGTSTAKAMANIAQRLVNNPNVVAAIAETAKKQLRSDAPAAVQTVREVMNDPMHKDRLKAASMILQRIDPVETKHSVEVTHKIDHDAEAVAQLRMLKSLNVAREKLEEMFGFTGLSRYEQMLALEDAKQAGPVVDAEFSVIETEGSTKGLEDVLSQ